MKSFLYSCAFFLSKYQSLGFGEEGYKMLTSNPDVSSLSSVWTSQPLIPTRCTDHYHLQFKMSKAEHGFPPSLCSQFARRICCSSSTSTVCLVPCSLTMRLNPVTFFFLFPLLMINQAFLFQAHFSKKPLSSLLVKGSNQSLSCYHTNLSKTLSLFIGPCLFSF